MALDEAEFQKWVDDMDFMLGEFFAELPESVRARLDYSVDSLDVLEGWLLARYDHYRSLMQKSELVILDGSARYIGETYRRHLGGYWYIDRKNNTYHGLPLVGGFGKFVAPSCPMCLATTCLDRRFGDLISRILRSEIIDQREQRVFEFPIELEE